MSIPLKVLNRLRLGRDIATRVLATLTDHSAWVYVLPFTALEDVHSIALATQAGERAFLNSAQPAKIDGFLVRNIEVSNQVLESFEAGDLYDPDNPTIDKVFICKNEIDLESMLLDFTDDLSAFHVPFKSGYVFNFGEGVIEPYGNKYYLQWKSSD